jgi:hypothetical protein
MSAFTAPFASAPDTMLSSPRTSGRSSTPMNPGRALISCSVFAVSIACQSTSESRRPAPRTPRAGRTRRLRRRPRT